MSRTTTPAVLLLSLAAAPQCACVIMATGDDAPPSGAVSTSSNEFAPTMSYTDSSCDSGQEIYLLGNDGGIRALEPTTFAVRDFPALRCTRSAKPNSMAVDSRGEAWVGFDDGSLFRATPSTGECRTTAFDGREKGWTRFGMGFIAQRGGKDALYLFDNGSSSLGLAMVDPQTEKLTPLGPMEAGGLGMELTGRGDGALFGLVSAAPTYVARVDLDGLRTSNRIDLPIAETLSWAFAHWGGRFYVFTSVSTGHSRIDVLSPGRGMKRVVTDLGFEVVGAGVSPCAPTEIR